MLMILMMPSPISITALALCSNGVATPRRRRRNNTRTHELSNRTSWRRGKTGEKVFVECANATRRMVLLGSASWSIFGTMNISVFGAEHELDGDIVYRMGFHWRWCFVSLLDEHNGPHYVLEHLLIYWSIKLCLLTNSKQKFNPGIKARRGM